MANGAIDYPMNTVVDTMDDDAHLVCAAQADMQVAGRLYDKYYERILRYLLHSTLNLAVAEDLTANVFLSAFRKLGSFRWQRVPFAAWLYRIATNELRMHYRRQRVSVKPVDDVAELVISETRSPHERLVFSEEQCLLHTALQELKPLYRTVIVLRYFEGLSIDGVANVVGKRPGTVKSQLSRGLSQLEGLLIRDGFSEIQRRNNA